MTADKKKFFLVFICVLFFVTGCAEKEVKTGSTRDQLLSPEKIESMFEEADKLGREGKLKEAEKKISIAYESFLKHGAVDTEKNVKYLKLLANLSLKLQKNSKAAIYSQTIIDVTNDELDKSLGYNNLGMAYQNKGRHGQAIGFLKTALKIALKQLGPDHPNVARVYNNLGVAYVAKNDYANAVKNYTKALEIVTRQFGPDHHATKTIKKNLDSIQK